MKHLAALALLAAAAASASAQSNVTMFGIVDVAGRYVKNGDTSLRTLGGNGLQSSRLGLRGVEDLGDGLKAGFWLETGLNPDTGTTSDATRFWNRRSTVSLEGSLGELRVGRDFTPTYTGYADYDVFGTNGVASADKFAASFGTAVDTNTRSDNEVSYFTPGKLGGFRGQLSYAPSENVAGKKYLGARAGYAAGPLDLSLAVGQTTVAPNARGDDKVKLAIVAGAYDFGSVKLMGYYSQARYADMKLGVVNLGAQVPLGLGTIRVSYIRADASGRNAAGLGTDGNDASQLAVGYVYDLSRRTALYTTAARVNNKAAAAFSVAGAPALPSPNTGRDSTGFEVGVRHRF